MIQSGANHCPGSNFLLSRKEQGISPICRPLPDNCTQSRHGQRFRGHALWRMACARTGTLRQIRGIFAGRGTALHDGGQYALLKEGGKIRRLEAGCLADAVVVDGNPLQDIAVFQDRSRFKAIFKSSELVKVSINDNACRLGSEFSYQMWNDVYTQERVTKIRARGRAAAENGNSHWVLRSTGFSRSMLDGLGSRRGTRCPRR
jgi:hypothetical protein